MLVVGAGKASMGIAVALERNPRRPARTAGRSSSAARSRTPLERIEALSADHPLPSDASSDAARRLLTIAESATDRDLVIACFTGGSSALASLPPAGISADEKRDLHELLLSSGIGIVEVNTVRKHVSAFKGGRLAAAAAPARLINLTVSDVAGDHIDAITDPSVPDSSRAADAIAVLHGNGLWARTPTSIREHLRSADAESPDLDPDAIQTVVLVTGTTACDAMAVEATALGLNPVVVSTSLEGEARQIGKLLANLANHSAADAAPFAPGTVMLGCGGESTVDPGPRRRLRRGRPEPGGGDRRRARARRRAGRRGLPRHRRLRRRHRARRRDRRRATVERAAGLGLDLRSALLEHRSHAALAALDDALVTGPTGTNVNDLFAIVIKEEQ